MCSAVQLVVPAQVAVIALSLWSSKTSEIGHHQPAAPSHVGQQCPEGFASTTRDAHSVQTRYVLLLCWQPLYRPGMLCCTDQVCFVLLAATDAHTVQTRYVSLTLYRPHADCTVCHTHTVLTNTAITVFSAAIDRVKQSCIINIVRIYINLCCCFLILTEHIIILS